ncbi:hypothetical protein [Archangium sp.]|uniref:hypothetical protein n=1 Tax=Archangium sp. TaxID=1872627 RepID=UPI00286A6031|nr:hypothetical protein [Archangium sp.]
MRRQFRSQLTLCLICHALALSACGPGSSFDNEQELGSLEQQTYGADLGRAVGPSVASTNTCGLSNDFKPSCGFSSGAPDVAYIWTAPWTANYTFTTQGSNFDTLLEVRPYNNTPQSLGCNDDSNGTLQSSVTASLSAGQTVLIITDGYGSACGGAKLNISSDVHMLFGGMYGGRYNGTYINPYTGAASCPAGYTAYRTLGTYNKDYDLYFCARFASDGAEPVADFAGAFGWYAGGSYSNPVIGGTSCPSGYLTTQALGTYNVDYEIQYCHRQHVAGTPGRYRFGGMYGYYWNGSTHATYVNPITGAASCPNGFTANRILGTYNVDYEVVFCYRDMGP